MSKAEVAFKKTKVTLKQIEFFSISISFSIYCITFNKIPTKFILSGVERQN